MNSKKMRINEVCTMGDGAHAKIQRVQFGVPYLTSKNIGQGVLKLDQMDYISEPDFERFFPSTSKSITRLHPGDVLTGIIGTFNNSYVYSSSDTFGISSAVAVLRPNKSLLSPKYLYYHLNSPQIQSLKEAIASGSVQGYTNLKVMGALPIRVPPLAEQNSIAEVLSALDDKIAANTKLASTADEWIRAEYDGFANRSTEMRTIAELVTHRRVTADPTLLEIHVPYVGLEHIPRRSMWLKEHGSSDEVSSNKSHFQSGDILFGKLRPYFHKVVTAPKAGICSTDVLVLAPIDETLSGHTLAALTHDSVVQAVTAASEGTRMPRTSWKDLSIVEIPWPGQAVAASFSAKVQTLRSSVISVLSENQALAATRDALLPQLVSGKLRVKDAEEIVSNAV